jgi:Kef-type K+ transport system membrane component KefB
MPIDRDAWAIAFGLNARGATGIILAGVGRAAGVIDDRIFVAIVVMALVTSILAGPMMNWLLSDRIVDGARGRHASSGRDSHSAGQEKQGRVHNR